MILRQMFSRQARDAETRSGPALLAEGRRSRAANLVQVLPLGLAHRRTPWSSRSGGAA